MDRSECVGVLEQAVMHDCHTLMNNRLILARGRAQELGTSPQWTSGGGGVCVGVGGGVWTKMNLRRRQVELEDHQMSAFDFLKMSHGCINRQNVLKCAVNVKQTMIASNTWI